MPAIAAVSELLIDEQLPAYDVVITERLVIDGEADTVFAAARDLDFMTVRRDLVHWARTESIKKSRDSAVGPR